LVDYALLSSDLGAEANELTDRGLTVDGPHDGGRVRPDGQRVAWRTLRSAQDGAPLPFLIDDQTPRPLRVPNGPATEHPSGYTGVAGVAIGVADLETAKQAYSKLLGTPGEAVTPSVPGAQSAWRFSFGDHWVELVQPDDQPGALRDQINARGEGPVEITVKTASSGNERYLPFDTTNGVRIKVV
jgi:catechol 2,3-dioxygenase-like lactoylglutathione lyase family enzyme